MKPRAVAARAQAARRGGWALASLALAAGAGAAALAGCSSSSSTTTSSGPPAYCTDRTNLENSIKGLTSLNASSGVSALKSQVDKISADASKLVNSAKGDFPTQTSAISSSVNTLKSSVSTLTSSPSAAQIGTVTKDAAAVVTSVSSFMTASSSKCS